MQLQMEVATLRKKLDSREAEAYLKEHRKLQAS
jgi:hypothetical protein